MRQKYPLALTDICLLIGPSAVRRTALTLFTKVPRVRVTVGPGVGATFLYDFFFVVPSLMPTTRMVAGGVSRPPLAWVTRRWHSARSSLSLAV